MCFSLSNTHRPNTHSHILHLSILINIKCLLLLWNLSTNRVIHLLLYRNNSPPSSTVSYLSNCKTKSWPSQDPQRTLNTCHINNTKIKIGSILQSLSLSSDLITATVWTSFSSKLFHHLLNQIYNFFLAQLWWCHILIWVLISQYTSNSLISHWDHLYHRP